jgi:hypothetical protein
MLEPAFIPIYAVVMIHCIWRVYQYAERRRQRTLRDRVAYMLWVTAGYCKRS